MRVLVTCTPPKKNSLSFMSGPPNVPPDLRSLQPVVASEPAVLRALEVADRVERVVATEDEAAAVERVGAGLA